MEEAVHWYLLGVAGIRLDSEALENLKRLGDLASLEARVSRAKEEILQLRTLNLGALLKDGKGKAEAEFFVVLAPAAAGKARVAGIRFIRGSENLRRFEKALESAPYRMSFPDETATKIIRRGILICESPKADCTFILLSPEYVKSVD